MENKHLLWESKGISPKVGHWSKKIRDCSGYCFKTFRAFIGLLLQGIIYKLFLSFCSESVTVSKALVRQRVLYNYYHVFVLQGLYSMRHECASSAKYKHIACLFWNRALACDEPMQLKEDNTCVAIRVQKWRPIAYDF